VTTSNSASGDVAETWVDVGLARSLGETLKRLLPALAGALVLQAVYLITSYGAAPLVAELALLNGLSAAVAWLGSLEARKGSIAITVENVAAALIALTVAVEILHVWLLSEIGFTLPLIAVQFAAGFLLSRSVVLWPILIGSVVADTINRRALLLGQIEDLKEASFDLYIAARDAYGQQRRERILGSEEAGRQRDEDLYFLDDFDEEEW
jgi:hypothetical protein